MTHHRAGYGVRTPAVHAPTKSLIWLDVGARLQVQLDRQWRGSPGAWHGAQERALTAA